VTKFSLLFFSSCLLASCALSNDPYTANARREPEIFRVGEVEVRLYQDRESMVRDLPPFFALLEATRVNNQRIKVNGFYDAEHKRIYSIDDAKVVIHEFKHYLEPAWRHETETPRSEANPLNARRGESEVGSVIKSVSVNRLSPEK
jgi:hypothetical protein